MFGPLIVPTRQKMQQRTSSNRSKNPLPGSGSNQGPESGLIRLSGALLRKVFGGRLLHIPVEGNLVDGFEGLDVGERVRVQLIDTNVERGFIDFKKAGTSRHG
jgi:hypothetical protein